MSAHTPAPVEGRARETTAFQPAMRRPTVPARRTRHRAPRRPLGPALAILCAPALVIGALTAFGVVADQQESGLGSLSASTGLQGAAVPTKPPKPAKKPAEADASAELASKAAGRRPKAEKTPDRGECARFASTGACRGAPPSPIAQGFERTPPPTSEPGSITGDSGESDDVISNDTGSGDTGSGDAGSGSGSGSGGTGSGGSGSEQSAP